LWKFIKINRMTLEERAHAAKALTAIARQAAEDIHDDMPRRFTLRNSWVQKGVRADSANRTSLMARVYDVDPYMVKQEEGQSWIPDGHVAIPAGVRTSKSTPIPKGMLPRALRSRTDVFKADFSTDGKYKPFPLFGLFQRAGRGKLRVLYLLKDEKHTKPAWDFADQVSRSVDRNIAREFEKQG
ncbi:MAG TPA: hypothetical protein VE954_21855, partial [Oligoflexus sp.]